MMKTTILGVLTLVATLTNAGIAFLKTGSIDVPATLAGLTAGWGLIHAADAKPAK
jgi:hypothetical protein